MCQICSISQSTPMSYKWGTGSYGICDRLNMLGGIDAEIISLIFN